MCIPPQVTVYMWVPTLEDPVSFFFAPQGFHCKVEGRFRNTHGLHYRRRVAGGNTEQPPLVIMPHHGR
jgi:hypothetical protein